MKKEEAPKKTTSDFVEGLKRDLEKRMFIPRILGIVIGYILITLWLNSIRINAEPWFVWVLIIIQFTLYCLIFSYSYTCATRLGLKKNSGFIIYLVLTILGKVNDWELHRKKH